MLILPQHKWLELINDSIQQQLAFHTGRGVVEDVTGKESNACAAVHSVLQRARGVTDTIHLNTGQMLSALLAAGGVKFTGWQNIQPGDSLFAEDTDGNKLSDHVYLALSKPDNVTKTCLVFDNYSSKPTRRNLTYGDKTPFSFGVRIPQKNTPPLNLVMRGVAKTGFGLLYKVWPLLPDYLQKEVNALRHDVFFNNL
jgi:hypothetical protein